MSTNKALVGQVGGFGIGRLFGNIEMIAVGASPWRSYFAI